MRGLGDRQRRALRDWLIQRVTAVVMALYTLFLIVLFFVLGGTFLGIVGNLTSALCSALAGPGVC